MRCTKNCNACSQYWSTEWAQFSTTSPDRVTQLLQKLNELDYKVLPLPPYSPDLSPTNYHIFKHLNNFLQGKCFHNQQAAENAFQELVKSWSTDFYATGITNLFLTGKYVLIVMVPILINKDVFESSYNNLKFMVQNNYFCTNLNTWCFTNYLQLYSFPSVFIFLVSRNFFPLKPSHLNSAYYLNYLFHWKVKMRVSVT